MTQDNSIPAAIAKAVVWVAAWLATVKLADIQLIVSIMSGCLVGGLAAVNLWVTVRDKLRRKR